MCLETLQELQAWEKNPMPDKVGIDSWILWPHYDGNCRLLDALCSLYFAKIELLSSVQSQRLLNGV